MLTLKMFVAMFLIAMPQLVFSAPLPFSIQLNASTSSEVTGQIGLDFTGILKLETSPEEQRKSTLHSTAWGLCSLALMGWKLNGWRGALGGAVAALSSAAVLAIFRSNPVYARGLFLGTSKNPTDSAAVAWTVKLLDQDRSPEERMDPVASTRPKSQVGKIRHWLWGHPLRLSQTGTVVERPFLILTGELGTEDLIEPSITLRGMQTRVTPQRVLEIQGVWVEDLATGIKYTAGEFE